MRYPRTRGRLDVYKRQSSDHMILDVTKSEIPYKVGDIVSFKLGYGGMLACATSPYVEKGYLGS